MDQTTHLVKLTTEEILEIIHAMTFTTAEGQDGDANIWDSIYEKLDKALEDK